MPSHALVGAVGGAGTTRLTLELAATMARDDRDVAVLDAAYATQGLADRLDRRVDPDVTALCLNDEPLSAGLLDAEWDVPGRVAVCPARAPFERVARAKSAEAASAFEDLVDDAAVEFEQVLVDTPPVAANQSVAAVNAADRVALVAPDADRGTAGLPRARDRLADLGVDVDATLVTRGEGDAVDADAAVPETDDALPAAPGDDEFAAAVAEAAATLGVDVEVEMESSGLL